MIVGTRIRLAREMQDDPDPIPVGTEGTVTWWSAPQPGVPWEQVGVAWDNGRKLGLACPPDRYAVLSVPEPSPLPAGMPYPGGDAA